jgi:hypothetical protein
MSTVRVEFIDIDPDEAEFLRPATPFDDPGFEYRDVHPGHRPVWHETIWRCTCSKYGSDRLPDMQRHAERIANAEAAAQAKQYVVSDSLDSDEATTTEES